MVETSSYIFTGFRDSKKRKIYRIPQKGYYVRMKSPTTNKIQFTKINHLSTPIKIRKQRGGDEGDIKVYQNAIETTKDELNQFRTMYKRIITKFVNRNNNHSKNFTYISVLLFMVAFFRTILQDEKGLESLTSIRFVGKCQRYLLQLTSNAVNKDVISKMIQFFNGMNLFREKLIELQLPKERSPNNKDDSNFEMNDFHFDGDTNIGAVIENNIVDRLKHLNPLYDNFKSKDPFEFSDKIWTLRFYVDILSTIFTTNNVLINGHEKDRKLVEEETGFLDMTQANITRFLKIYGDVKIIFARSLKNMKEESMNGDLDICLQCYFNIFVWFVFSYQRNKIQLKTYKYIVNNETNDNHEKYRSEQYIPREAEEMIEI